MSDSVRPHRWQPTRLPRPWDSPDKNTGVGCHCLLQCMKVKSESEVAQSCPTPRDPMDCSPPGSSIHGISQARVSPRVTFKIHASQKYRSQNKEVKYSQNRSFLKNELRRRHNKEKGEKLPKDKKTLIFRCRGLPTKN